MNDALLNALGQVCRYDMPETSIATCLNDRLRLMDRVDPETAWDDPATDWEVTG